MQRILKSSWFMVLKISLMLLSFYFIFFHISQQEVLEKLELLSDKLGSEKETRISIYTVVALMSVNWFCESIKWKWLTSLFYRQTLFASARAVLTGLAVSFFTPNRSGDFAGRIMLLPSTHRVEGAVFSIVGSLAQMLITITAGTLATISVMGQLFKLSVPVVSVISIIALIIVVFFHYLFFNVRKYRNFKTKISLFKKLLSKTADVEKLTFVFLLKIYMVSFLRYAVFTFQFCILLKTFDVNISWHLVATLVMVSFLLLSVIPSFALTEIGVRGSVCIFLFSKFTPEISGVLIASTTLWIINVVSPAIAGAFGMLYFKWNK